MAEPAQLEIVTTADDANLLFAGAPDALVGYIDVRNPGRANVVLRDATIHDPAGIVIPSRLHRSVAPIVLRPNQERRVPVKIAVDPTTPPGEYPAELEIGGRSRSALLRVAESFRLSLSPDVLVIENVKGRKQSKQILIRNEGNVAFALGDIGDVDLEEDVDLEIAAQRAVASLPESLSRDREGPVLAVVKVGRPGSFREAALFIKCTGGRRSVAPGASALIDLEITLNATLPHSRRYRGRAPVLTEDLDIVVVSSGETEHRTAAPGKTSSAARTKK